MAEVTTCPHCMLEAADNSIFCEVCHCWFHLKCSKLNKKSFVIYSIDDKPWYCHTCLQNNLPFVSCKERFFITSLHNSSLSGVHGEVCITCQLSIGSYDFCYCKIGPSKMLINF